LQQVEERLATLKQELASLKKSPPPRPPLAMSVNDQERPGSMESASAAMPTTGARRFPRVHRNHRAQACGNWPNVSGRAELAAWLTSRDNPLTSRVAVNRVWHHLFGKGLVGSVDDFGTRGDRPTHPELLDHLASRFMEDGWSLKRLIRELVLSRTYRLSSNGNADGAARDPENRWLWRMNRRRLQIESLRDGMLAIAGQLDPTPAESVVAHLSVQATGVGVKPNKVIPSSRRTVYLPVVRNDLPTFLPLFDFGDSQTVNGRRSSTNVAPQALFMMNSPLVFEGATHAARRALLGNDGRNNDDLLELLYVQILNRPPRPAEVGPSLALIQAALAEATPDSSTGSSTGGMDDNSARVRPGPFSARHFLFDQLPVSRLRGAACATRQISEFRDGNCCKVQVAVSAIWPSPDSRRRPPRPNETRWRRSSRTTRRAPSG